MGEASNEDSLHRKIRLFLSSPNDVEAERIEVHRVVTQINRRLGDFLGFHLEVMDWKTHVLPGMGRPQEVINSQIHDYDIYVGIMWKRFGTPTGEAESGTEEEFNLAYENWQRFQRPHILFYFSRKSYTLKNSEEIAQCARVMAFKEKLGHQGLIIEYESPEKFSEQLGDHLTRFLLKTFPLPKGTPLPADFHRYLTYLRSETMYINIRGLMTGEGRAHNFRIDELYIPLKTTGAGLPEGENAGKKGPGKPDMYSRDSAPHEVPLQEALQEPRLIIKGDPGAGKSTFLRLLTFTLCCRWLEEEVKGDGRARILWPEPPPLPIFIPLGELINHIIEWKAKGLQHTPVQEDDPEWILHFLGKQSERYNLNLQEENFRRKLEGGNCLLLFDGLDEAPDAASRRKVSSLVENVFKACPRCQVAMTSRPAAMTGPVIPPGFSLVEIAPLDDAAIDAFLEKWSHALYPQAPESASAHRQDLDEALRSKPEIQRMARTPVMLTALAVVHWNEHKLPEQRVELYESIITWLVRSRKQDPKRPGAERCTKLLQKLALAMFTHPDGRQKQVGLRWAAEKLMPDFIPKGGEAAPDPALALEQAESFLQQELVDSGIIIDRDHKKPRLEFWHLSFQEYLAACGIAGLLEQDQQKVLFPDNERIYSSEWREVMLLLGGVLYKQGEDKINHVIDEIIIRGPQQATNENLPLLAREVGLLGGLVRDLSSFRFMPSNSRYQGIMQSVMGIFEKSTYRDIPVQVRLEAADALGRAGDPRLQNVPMVHIPGGIFWMGAQKRDKKQPNFDPDCYDDEAPVHQVEVSAFSISKYPVTVIQYQRFMDDGGYEEKQYWQEGGFGEFQKPEKWEDQQQYPSRPVVGVSWYEAAAYARWAGGRLPTEAEWERAARGPGQDYRKYPWGNKEPDKETANYKGIGHVSPVGVFPESCSPEGVIDLAGNMWEWCLDWFSEEYYHTCSEQGVVKDPPGPEKGDGRVVRGGAYGYIDPNYLRCAFRDWYYPHYRNSNVGFRMVRVAQL
ncbi:MAG: SUMF1/EgtB/PvdO family nonheme iron enzyme [bacterium]